MLSEDKEIFCLNLQCLDLKKKRCWYEELREERTKDIQAEMVE
jgi:hypothetical protein